MELRLIGDVHGKFMSYGKLLDHPNTLQVGDMGVGFTNAGDANLRSIYATSKGNHKFIRGNHDNPAACKHFPQWIPDGHFDADTRIFCVGGAWSIDHAWRTMGVDIWEDEQLSYEAFQEVIDAYQKIKPPIVVTHDIPTQVAKSLFKLEDWNQTKTLTGEALQVMFDLWQPKLWVFGHWHMCRREVIGRTRFVCLEELSWIDINTEEFQ